MQLKHIMSILILCISVQYAQVVKVVADKYKSSIKYLLIHPMHRIEAESKEAYCDMYADFTTREIKHCFVKGGVQTFNSGNSSRDSHAMEVIDAITYPEAKFSSTSCTPAGDSILVTGKMTFHGVTRDESFYVKCNWGSEFVTVKGSFALSLTAYKVERPSLLMVPTEDYLHFTVEEVFWYPKK